MKKPVQHEPKRVDMKLIFPFSGICLGTFPSARKQKQIGATAIVSQKPEDVKRPRPDAAPMLDRRHK